LLQSFHGALGKEMLTNSYPIMTKQSFLQVSSFLQKKKKKKRSQSASKLQENVPSVCIRIPVLQLKDDDDIASMIDYHVQYPYFNSVELHNKAGTSDNMRMLKFVSSTLPES